MTTPSTQRATYTVEEASAILGISRSAAYEYVKAGHLAAVRIGRRILVPKITLDQLLNTPTAGTTPSPSPIA